MSYIPNPRAGEWNQPDQIWRDDVDNSGSAHPGHAKFLVALIGLALLPWLYPITAGLVIGAALTANEVAGALGLPSGVHAVAVAVAALLLLMAAMRAEQRLGTLAVYRWTRHAMRLLVPAVFINLLAREEMGLQEPSVATLVGDTLNNSSLFGGTIAVVVLAQLVLWFAGWVRDDWHASLEVMRMRSTKLAG